MKYHIIGKGFIYPKHKKAIEDSGGEIVEYKDADTIVILAPTYLHYEMILEAIKNNKKVICEKPLCLKAEEMQNLINSGKEIKTVFQMRYHPALKDIRVGDWNIIEVVVDVHRDEEYFKTWKGSEEQSGGILFNLGIHYLDLVNHLFGYPKDFHPIIIGPKENTGYIRGDKYICNYRFSYKADRDKQKRLFNINGKNYNLDGGENLHKFIYQNEPIPLSEVLEVTNIIKKLNLDV